MFKILVLPNSYAEHCSTMWVGSMTLVFVKLYFVGSLDKLGYLFYNPYIQVNLEIWVELYSGHYV